MDAEVAGAGGAAGAAALLVELARFTLEAREHLAAPCLLSSVQPSRR